MNERLPNMMSLFQMLMEIENIYGYNILRYCSNNKINRI